MNAGYQELRTKEQVEKDGHDTLDKAIAALNCAIEELTHALHAGGEPMDTNRPPIEALTPEAGLEAWITNEIHILNAQHDQVRACIRVINRICRIVHP